MYIPPTINEILLFPTSDKHRHILIPNIKDIEVGDIIVAKYESSRWARWLPWENWHHVALVSKISPLTIIEAVGKNSVGQWPGPIEVEFEESVGFGKAKNICEMSWLKPVFPNPLRKMDAWYVPRSIRKIISEHEARKRVVTYARNQLGEPYSPVSSKWNENSWYCSSIVYKSYSRSITGMYLESYDDVRAGYLVTPDDLLKSKRTKKYYSWEYSKLII